MVVLGIFSAGLATVVFWKRPGELRPVALLTVLVGTVAAACLAGWWLGERLAGPWANFVRQLAHSRKAVDHPLLHGDTDEPLRQEATQEVNALLAELAQVREQLNGFSAKVAHELRSPITLLQLQIDYASGKLDPGLVEGLRTQIKRLTDYVDVALLVARAEQGNVPVAKENVDLTELVTELLQPYELRAKASRRPLQAGLKRTGAVKVDAKIFGLIFNNLMSNAFYHGTGEIRVRLDQRRKTSELLILNRVRQRSSGSATSSYEAGTGMGLKTACQLARAHGGLSVETRVRRTSFVARIRFA